MVQAVELDNHKMPPRASQPLPQHEAHGSSGGFLAALTLLLVAYTNLSLAGGMHPSHSSSV
jgi:hypothetical protein